MTNDDTDTDSLASVIKTLQQRIRDRATGRNETRTRNVLINPLLDGLGWSDPSVVTHEYSIEYGRGFVDYALHPKGQKGRPIAFIEAKRLRETLCDDHLNQVLKYASKRDSVRYVGLTNGDRWQFYEIFEGGWGLIFEISLRHESAFDCAAQLVRFKRRLEGLEDAEDTEGLGDLGLTQETGQTLYHQLGVDQSASREALREAYRRKIRQVHPDVSVDGLAHEKTKRINEAYSVLRDPIRRSQYDRELAATRKAPQETSPHPERPAPPPPPRYQSDSSSTQSWTHPQPDPNRAVNVSIVIAWSVFAFAICAIIGYVIGFRAAQPILEGFAGTVGAWVVGTAASVAVVAILFCLPWGQLSLGWLFSAERYTRRTLIWSCGCIVACGVLGGVLGYAGGLRTAQLIYDIFAVVGTIAIVIVLAVVLIFIIVALNSASRQGRRY